MKPLALAIALAAILLAPAALAAALLVLGPSAWAGAMAAESLLEPGVRIDEQILEMEETKAAEMVHAAVMVVRAHGYRCDSVSQIGLRSRFLSRAWYAIALSCNRFRYSYWLEDIGGRWVAKPD